ncbi:pentapeptide repeat-containing protein [Rhodococcus sp. NPDC056743]|uniref:pentapeptide repeat-containing protein n=1 Tax=Rhodococcus sp. NPDC056743 TaxID=3345934 RepID=UPI003671F237
MDYSSAAISSVEESRATTGTAYPSGEFLRGGADFVGANLSDSNLSGAYFSGADLTGTVKRMISSSTSTL